MKTASPQVVEATPLKRRNPSYLKQVAGGVFGKKRKAAASSAAPAKPISYDAEDIEEANRIGAAISRQHAR